MRTTVSLESMSLPTCNIDPYFRNLLAWLGHMPVRKPGRTFIAAVSPDQTLRRWHPRAPPPAYIREFPGRSARAWDFGRGVILGPPVCVQTGLQLAVNG